MHTLGPWRLEGKPNSDGEVQIVAGGTDDDPDAWICHVAGGLGRVSELPECLESEANARLIAAAPTLLRAAEDAAKWLREHDVFVSDDVRPGYDAICDGLEAAVESSR